MIFDPVLEAILIVVAIRTAMNLLAFPEDVRGLVRAVRACRVPVSALTIGAALTTGVVLEVIWSGALRTLERDGHDWQVFTAPFVQDGGITGAVFNLASALIVIALTAWIWGDWAAAAIWLVGAWAPIGAAAHLVGYRVSTSHATAYSAGSSGATYFAAGTLCAAMLLSAGDRRRWLGLIAPAIAVGMWIGTNDGHGVVLVAGFVVSLAVVALYRLTGAASAHRRTRSRRATGTGRMTRCDEDLLDSVR